MIRLMEQNDIDRVKGLIDSSFPINIKRGALLATLGNPNKHTFVLTSPESLNDGNQIIGTIGTRGSKIVWLCIDSAYRRQGYAKQLMVYVLSWLNNPYLYVKVNNLPAIELYKSLGFMVVGTHANSYRMEPSEPYD